MASTKEGEWTFGHWDCLSDPGTCCFACWCPCCAVGQVRQMIDTENLPDSTFSCGDTTKCGLHFLLSAVSQGVCGCLVSNCNRTSIRDKYKLPEVPCGDMPFHCCCQVCANTQELREMRVRIGAGGPEGAEMARA